MRQPSTTKAVLRVFSLLVSLIVFIVSAFAVLPAYRQYVLSLTQTPTAVNSVTPHSTLASPSAPAPASQFPVTPEPGSTPLPVITQLAELRNQIQIIQHELTAIPNASSFSPQISSIEEDQKSLEGRLSTIESVILDNPAKSLELTQLREEIDSIKSDNSKDAERTQKELDRIYTQNNWFIGLLVTLALSLFTLAVSNVIGVRKSGNSEKH